jgi:hypothetical protein
LFAEAPVGAVDDANPRVLLGSLIGDGRRGVGGTVVDNHPKLRANRLGDHRVDCLWEAFSLVADGSDDGVTHGQQDY